MSSGSKLNHAKDNAANYSIATNLTTKISALQVAENNANMGLDMVQTASNILSNMSNLSSQLRALALQAQNGTYDTKSLNAVNAEVKVITKEIVRLKETASYNGLKLFNDFNSTVPSFSDGSHLVPNEQGFLVDIVERDTTAMDRLEDVDSNLELTGGTYSITTAEGLIKLSEMSRNSKIKGACEFVLGDDIDISEYCRSNLDVNGEGGWLQIGKCNYSTFDGNGHIISGLYINRPNSNHVGFAGSQVNLNFKNLGFVNPEIHGKTEVGTFASGTFNSNPYNCFVEGGIITGQKDVGGLVGGLNYSSASYCYTTCDVIGNDCVGGISAWGGAITNCYSTGTIQGDNNVGGISGTNTTKNCAVYGVVYGNTNVGIFSGIGKVTDGIYNQNVNIGMAISGNPNAGVNNIIGINFGAKVDLQIGAMSEGYSQINFEAWFALDGLSRLNKISLSDSDYLNMIDSILEQINKKQTEYGAVENRIYTILDEISTQYENLVSTRSTIQDADMSKITSQYIRYQILQEASATLMASAQNLQANTVLGLLQGL